VGRASVSARAFDRRPTRFIPCARAESFRRRWVKFEEMADDFARS
jgi:hypothetical protein